MQYFLSFQLLGDIGHTENIDLEAQADDNLKRGRSILHKKQGKHVQCIKGRPKQVFPRISFQSFLRLTHLRVHI